MSSNIYVSATIEIPNGNVTIGGNTNSNYPFPLTILSSTPTIGAWSYRTWDLNNNFTTGFDNINNVSAYIDGSILAIEYTAYSDKRIKNDIVELDDNESLNLINQLEVKKYKYKDVIKRSNTETYGFIAQQVEDVIPLATNTKSDYLPSIYELGDISEVNGNVLITTTNNLDLGNTEIYGNLTTPLSFRFYDKIINN